MIASFVTDPLLDVAARRAARLEEDVVGGDDARDALRRGFPRAVLRYSQSPPRPWERIRDRRDPVPTIFITADLLAAWESHRKAQEIPGSRLETMARQLRAVIRLEADRPTWVDDVLRDLTLALGRDLPPAFRGFARRVLEYPAAYVDLGSLADLSGLSRGALKARFRRRGLASPFLYLRWLRVVAAAHLLGDRSRTMVEVADRIGCTTGGNFCRFVALTTGSTPSSLREAGARSFLLATLAQRLREDGPEAWVTLDDLFLRVA